jgi:hypothetical protein
VHVTADGGKNWKEVTPPSLTSWDKISQIDAGHFDALTAYISVNAVRKDDMRPHIYRTHDGGATWKKIITGINQSPVNVVREDPLQKGVLFAGTEREVVFSIDDGENWQSLRMNMPATSVRDLVIHENDLVVGTHGRSIWIMDNISPLRNLSQVSSSKKPYLSPPAQAIRIRYNMFSDTPLPPEEPAGQNPPDGAIFDYWINQKATDVRLEIIGSTGEAIRRYSSKDKAPMIDTLLQPHPTYWIRPAQSLSTEQGHHRFVWDLRYTEPTGASRQFSIAAVYRNTPSGPQGPFVHPDKYKVRLTVDGVVQEKEMEVRLDPRVAISEADLKLQSKYSLECYVTYHELQKLRESIDAKLNDTKIKWATGKREQLMAFRGEGAPENPDVMYGSISESTLDNETVVGLQDKFLHLMAVLQSTEAKPTSVQLSDVMKLKIVAFKMKNQWDTMR